MDFVPVDLVMDVTYAEAREIRATGTLAADPVARELIDRAEGFELVRREETTREWLLLWGLKEKL